MTLIVHNPGTVPTWAGREPPVSWITCVPGTAVTVPPEQVVLTFGTGATVKSAGRLSTTATSTSGEVLVFCKVIVRVDMPNGDTAAGVNVLLTERSLKGSTVRVAVRLPGGVRFWSFVISAGVMTLRYVPGVSLVTQTSIRHKVPAWTVPPVKVITLVPVTAVRTAPAPQLATLGPCELLMTTPAGRLSVTEKFVKVMSAGAVILILNRELPPTSMVEGLKLLLASMPVPAA